MAAPAAAVGVEVVLTGALKVEGGGVSRYVVETIAAMDPPAKGTAGRVGAATPRFRGYGVCSRSVSERASGTLHT